jgi:tagatose kinase
MPSAAPGERERTEGPRAGPLVLVVGEALVEVMRARPDVPLDRAGELVGPCPSGAPAIFASAAARLGARVELCAAVGDDPFGRMLRRRLARDGVGTGALAVVGRATGVAFVSYSSSGEREFLFHARDAAPGALGGDALDDLPERAAWLHLSGSSLGFGDVLAGAVLDAARRVRAAGGRVGFDPNVRDPADPVVRERLAEAADLADVLFPSRAEVGALGDAIERALERNAVVCVTEGEAGATLHTRGGRQRVPARSAVELDPTGVGSRNPPPFLPAVGAGDAFAAGFTVSLLAGASPIEAARRGAEVGALSAAAFGPMELAADPST